MLLVWLFFHHRFVSIGIFLPALHLNLNSCGFFFQNSNKRVCLNSILSYLVFFFNGILSQNIYMGLSKAILASLLN